ncbi:MAG: GTPase Era [Gammaproteobacteria bacterium]
MTDSHVPTIQYCGFVAIVGRPNVGKSTLLNHILGKKISITSRKPQTTRQRILGIKNTNNVQTIYVDTPGFHQHGGAPLNQFMNSQVNKTVGEVDIIVFVITAKGWTEADERLYTTIKDSHLPIFLVINKIDEVADKTRLLPHIEKLSQAVTVQEVIPLAALTGKNVPTLEACIARYLPKGVPLFPEEQMTDSSEPFLAAEIIREKITRALGEELPYITGVTIESFKKEKTIWHIHGVIFVERPGQKAIIIGKQGERLKRIGQQARLDMERLFGIKIFLQLWVKVRKGWTHDPYMLEQLGYYQDNS